MPDQSQGSASSGFQLEKTICGSSYIASLNALRAKTTEIQKFPMSNNKVEINDLNARLSYLQ